MYNKSAKSYKFETDNGSGKMVETTLYSYFATKYNIRRQCPDLPLVRLTKGKNIIFSTEILMTKESQRYNYKMDEEQTADMINLLLPRHLRAGYTSSMVRRCATGALIRNFGSGSQHANTLPSYSPQSGH